MIVGIDVYHEKNKQVSSIVGIVASLDKTFTQWCSVVKKQPSTHQELLASIQISFHELLKKYQQVSFIFILFPCFLKYKNETYVYGLFCFRLITCCQLK